MVYSILLSAYSEAVNNDWMDIPSLVGLITEDQGIIVLSIYIFTDFYYTITKLFTIYTYNGHTSHSLYDIS